MRFLGSDQGSYFNDFKFNVAKRANIKQGSQLHKLYVMKFHQVHLIFLEEVLRFDPTEWWYGNYHSLSQELVKRGYANKGTFLFLHKTWGTWRWSI